MPYILYGCSTQHGKMKNTPLVEMKTKNTLLAIAGILLALLTIKTCKLENELQTSNGQLQTLIDHPVIKTDTVWETKVIQPPKELPNEVKPAKVTLPKESQSPNYKKLVLI